MPRAFSSEVVIDRAPQVVWRTLTNWMFAPKWMSGIDALIPNGPNRVGTLLKFSSGGDGYQSEILVYDKASKLVLQSQQDNIVADYTYTLEQHGEQTRVSLDVTCTVSGGFFKVVPWLLHGMVWLSDSSQLKKLKKLIEK